MLLLNLTLVIDSKLELVFTDDASFLAVSGALAGIFVLVLELVQLVGQHLHLLFYFIDFLLFLGFISEVGYLALLGVPVVGTGCRAN